MFGKDGLRKLLNENYPLLSILVGITLVSLSIGPFQNGDTQWEYEAATGVVKWGIPYVNNFGNLMNQPPLGFYIEALFFKLFGSSINTGTFLITLIGLGSTVLLYKVGKELYDKPTGLFAAALFALSPWELVLSRSFLIDAQCLFFSLLCLYVGILSIRKGSVKLSLISGVFFAAALLTKDFAAFILIPLLIFYVYSRPKNPKHILSQLTAFLLPVLLFSFLWYQAILGKELQYMLHSSDFSDLNYSGVVLSYSFVANFLWNYGLGFFFVIAVAFSLLLFFAFRKEFPKIFLAADLICLATILPILILDMILGAGLNLKAPYNNAIKYDYLALPFFSLIAASLVGKCLALLKSTKTKTKVNKKLIFSIVMIGALLLMATIFANINSARQLSLSDYLLFRVTMDQAVGYSLFNYTPIPNGSLLMNIQYVGYAILLSGLLWASRHKLHDFFNGLFKPMRRWTKARNSQVMQEKKTIFNT
ncbi:MAG: glycosyltransferase family 39 protein [Candidatus Bathyarchaeia archaeon]|jgi:4-amino-4-deoxy-L-arabinose transferase-like glycosyltransferase